MTALNIPMEDGHIADWHFTGAFLHPSSRFHIAGENRLDTHDHLGDYGIRECSDVLRRFGAQVAPGQKVYAATYVRAILDLVLSSILNGHFRKFKSPPAPPQATVERVEHRHEFRP